MITTEQYAKLPKWAQQEIATLTRQKAELNARIKDILGEEKSRIYVEHDTLGKHTQYIPNRERVFFEMDEGTVQAYFANQGKTLTIQGDSSLLVVSQSSNTIRIGVMTREQERDLR